MTTVNIVANQDSLQTNSNIKLPHLNLSMFSGKYSECFAQNVSS